MNLRGQNGQALVEAIVVLALLSGVMAAAAFIGRQHDRRLHNNHRSRELAFLASRDASGRYMRAPLRSQVGGDHETSRRLRSEWAFEDRGFVMGQAGQMTAVIMKSSGHASSLAATQQRIGQSASAWTNAARRSMAVARRMARRTKGTDAAWPRAKPTFDWLRAWVDIMPTLPKRMRKQP